MGLLGRRRHAVEQRDALGGLSFADWYRLTVGSTAYTWATDSADMSSRYGSLYARNPVINAAVTARQSLFSEARFAFQRFRDGRPGDLFTTDALSILERPSPRMTTADLLAVWETDVSIAGNAFAFSWRGQLVVPRPQRVEVAVVELRSSPDAPPFATEVAGYVIHDDTGVGEALVLPPEEVAHYVERPDPANPHVGLSWITAAFTETVNDDLLARHKRKFWENAATPNMVIQSPQPLSEEQFERLRQMVDRRYAGVENAHKTLLLEGGASAEVVGADLSSSSALSTMQDTFESRISLASRVPAPVLGILLGQNPTYNNYSTALRAFIDLWARPAWRRAAGALEAIVAPPGADARLWFDDRDIAALRSDSQAQADIRSKDAQTARTLVDGGYTPDSVAQFLASGDPRVLDHTGLLPVQVQPPGAQLNQEA